MRRVSNRRVSAGAVLSLLVLSTFAFADEPGPFDPPQARIMPPIGIAAPGNEPALPDEVRAMPPGEVASHNRISPPIGMSAPARDRNLFDLLWLWLQVQVKISPPIG